MKVFCNNAEYPCNASFVGDEVKIAFEEKPEDEISGKLTIAADNNFIMRIVSTEDFARTYWDGNVFVLTNIPEPEIITPDEPTPEPDSPVEPEEDVTWEAMAESINEGVNEV